MCQNLFYFISRFATLSDEELSSFLAIFKPLTLAKLDHLFIEGEYVDSLFFLEEGVMRGYYRKENEDITSHFYFGPTLVTDLVAVRERKSTRMNVQALKHSNCMEASFSDIDDLISRYPNIELVFFKFLEHLYLFGASRQYSFIMDSPQERYLKLFNERPKVVAEIPLRYIASYLGIQPETLSRIRNRIFKNL
ncbi:Crp/Fnr family transcriptional regulator [Flavobacterium sp.]|jgi:CRP-like cAMP-binding protein|uniref:Crp/Fnr family transcriptional regulator n=1 Tax=Flavobacterium sp. TaxID=239 RepID=UPI003919F142